MADLQASSNLNFIGALLLHARRRDTAIGLTHLTSRQRGLLWYYRTKRDELARNFTQAAITKGLIDGIDKRMAEIMQEEKTATTERKRELLTEALKLKAQAEGLTDG